MRGMGWSSLLAGLALGVCFAVTALFVSDATALAAECTNTWVGPATGTWEGSENWSAGHPPSPADVACVPGGNTVDLESAGNEVAVLQGEGRLDILSGSLALVGGEASNIGVLKLPGGSLRGSAELFVTKSLEASGGSMEGAGRTVVGAEATARVEPAGAEGPGLRLTDKRTLTVAGELTVAGGGGKLNVIEAAALSVGGAGALTVGGPEGRITAKESGDLNVSGSMVTNGPSGQTNLLEHATLLNSGSFVLKAPEGGLVAQGDARVRNTGSLKMEAQDGEIRLEEATLENVGGLRLEAPEGQLRGSDEARIENSGTLAINGEGLLAGPGAVSRLVNTGTVRKDEGEGMSFVQFKVDNEDLVKSEEGTLSFSAGGNSGLEHKDKWVGEGGSLAFIGSAFTFGAVSEMRGWSSLYESASVKGHRIEGDEAELNLESSDLEITGAGEKSSFDGLGIVSSDVSVIKNAKIGVENLFLEAGELDLGAGVASSVESFSQEGGRTSVGSGAAFDVEFMFVRDGRVALDPNVAFKFSNYTQRGEADFSLESGGTLKGDSVYVNGGSLELRANSEGSAREVFMESGAMNVRKNSSLEGREVFLQAGSLELGTNSSYVVDDFFGERATTTIGSSAVLNTEDGFLERGVLAGEGIFKVDTLGWEESTMAGSGVTVIEKAGTLNGSALASLKGRRLVSEGAFSTGKSTLEMSDGARLVNNGVLDASSEQAKFGAPIHVDGSSTSAPRIVNRSKFEKKSGSGTTKVTVPFENNGAIRQLSGTLRITDRVGVSTSEVFGSRCHCGDPVETASGDFSEDQTDIAIGGRGVGLVLSRTYSAQAAAAATAPGAFGYGWFNSFSDRLEFREAEGEVPAGITVIHADGSTVPFTSDGEGGFDPPPWSQDSLTGNPESGYVYVGSNQIQMHFAPSGALQGVVDRNGNDTSLSYTEAGKLKTITDPAGREINLTYNGEGFVESAEDPMGHLVHYEYAGNELTGVTMPGAVAPRWQFEYDAQHRITKVIDGRGGETTNEYDESSRVISQTDPAGRTLTLEYDGFHTMVTNVATGAVTDQWFNSGNQATSITNGFGTEEATTETFTYDEAGRRLTRTDGNGHIWSYGYDVHGNRTSEVDPLEQETEWTYNEAHQVLTETKPSGEETTIGRDANGNPESVSRPASESKTQTVSYEYGPHGETKSMIDPLGHVWNYEYDSHGDLEAEIDPEGDKRSWTYDEDSRVISATSPRGNEEGAEAAKFTTSIERDVQGRPLKVTDPLEGTTQYAYDANGNVESVTDPNGRKTKFTYDPDNERTKVERPNGAVEETGYDGAGQITSQTDGNEQKTTYVRNVLGQPVKVIDPLERITTSTFDAVGNLKTKEDPDGRTTTYAYDDANRLKEISYSDGITPKATFDYDKNGNLTSLVDGTGESTYEYDQLDRIIHSKDGNGDTVSWEYNLGNESVGLTYPNGKSISRLYDKAGRLESVTDWLGNTTSFAYNKDSELSRTAFPAGTGNVDEFAFDRAGRMSAVTMKKGGEALASLSYSRDKAGQVESLISKGLPGAEEESFAYDENERLKTAGAGGYEYDNANNLTKAPGTTNAFDSASQLKSATEATFSYDKDGERTKRTPSSGPATTYKYDQAGNLTAVERAEESETPAIAESFGYDGTGLLASRTAGLGTHHLTWDLGEGLPLLLGDGENSYVYGPNGLPIEQISTGESPIYLHHDQLGSTRLLTNSSGEVAGTTTFAPYGAVAGKTGSATTTLGFAGQYTLDQSGLQYLRARFYDPATAQFMTVDPLVEGTRARYFYTGDNPLSFYDPIGAFALPALGTVCADPEVTLGCILLGGGVAGIGAIAGHDDFEGILNTILGGSEGGDEGESFIRRQNAEEAKEDACGIAKGHAFDKHGEEFGVDTPEELEEIIDDTISGATHTTNLERGRTAYYDEETNTLVIIDPSSPDGGTVYKPANGLEGFDKLK